MAKPIKPGDQVTWNSPQGEIKGKVEKKLTTTTKVKGHVAKPTPDHPEFLVKSEKTGAKAIHQPAQLKKS